MEPFAGSPRPSVMKLSRLVLAVALAGAAGCASPSAAVEPSASYSPADLVLQVRTGGGFTPMYALVTEMPEISIYGDGRVITTGPLPKSYPGPALPNVQIQHISPADVQVLARRALKAGVGDGTDLGMPNVVDGPSTRVTVRMGSSTVTTNAHALGLGADEDLTGAQRSARQRLKALVDALGDLPGTLGKDAVDGPAAYVPARIAVVASEWKPASEGQPSDPPAVAWPGPALPGETVANFTGLHCLVTDAPPVLAAAQGANSRTPWTSAGARWSVQFRLLLPHEVRCSDLPSR
jgi:hypothetical protein